MNTSPRTDSPAQALNLPVLFLALAGDGRAQTIHLGYLDKVYRVAAGGQVTEFAGGLGSMVQGLAADPSGNLCVGSGTSLYLFDSAGGGTVIERFHLPISALAWHPPSGRLLIGGVSGSVFAYDGFAPTSLNGFPGFSPTVAMGVMTNGTVVYLSDGWRSLALSASLAAGPEQAFVPSSGPGTFAAAGNVVRFGSGNTLSTLTLGGVTNVLAVLPASFFTAAMGFDEATGLTYAALRDGTVASFTATGQQATFADFSSPFPPTVTFTAQDMVTLPPVLYFSAMTVVSAPSAIPEPSTYAALASLAALGFVAWRRRLQSTA
jgi:hypothetical protein